MINLVQNFMACASKAKTTLVEAYKRNEDKIIAMSVGVIAGKVFIEQELHPIGMTDNIGTAMGVLGMGVLGKAFLTMGAPKTPDADMMFKIGGGSFATISTVLIAGHYLPNPFS